MQRHKFYPGIKALLATPATVLTLALGILQASAADTTPPVISGVPADATVQCSSIPAPATPTATDDTDPNPSIVLLQTSTQGASGCGKYSYTITRTWTATDSSSNSSSATQLITVQDTTPPVISYIPASTNVECSAVPAPPTAVSGCATNTTAPQLLISDGTPGGTILITDQGTNDSSAIAGQITYAGPVGSGWSINITTALTAPAPGGGSSIQPTMILNTINVGSGQLTIEFSANGFCANGVMQSQVGGVSGGNIQFKTFIDTGNTNFGKQTLVQNFGPIPNGSFSSNAVNTITPSLPYSITLQTVINHTTNAVSQFSSQVGVFVPTATDNCDTNPALAFAETSTQTPTGFGHENYVITRTWTATDACGNTSSAQQTINVHDTTAPVITGIPADTTAQCNAIPGAVTPTVTDNCDPSPTITLAESSTQTPSGIGHFNYTLTRTWTATDASGHSSTGHQTIVVHDTTAPVLGAPPADVTVQCDAIPIAASVSVTDNCDPSPTVSVSDTTSVGSCVGNYFITRTWTATDACGNSSTTSQHITVIDTTSPVLVGVPPDATVDCNAVPPAANVTATDNCDTNVTVSLTTYSTQTPTGPGHDSYILKRKWTATDSCGNSATAQQILTVAPIAPVITGFPADVTYSCSGDVPAANDNLITATDPCAGGPVYIYHDGDVITDLTCANRYNITRTYHATNVCGIVASRTQHITVDDTNAPTITAFPADATLNCMCDVPAVNDAVITAIDDCSSVTVTHTADVTNNIIDALHFDIQRTYIVSDVCGNQTNYTQTFHMNLFSPPFVTITGAPYISVSTPNYTAHGTAGSTFPLAGVYYSLNGGGYQLATGTANWSAQLHLVPGTNILTAYAVDSHSQVSTTAVATVFYSVLSRLTVQIRDWPEPNRIDPNAGTLTPNLNGQLLEVGRNYTMTATPLGPHRFVGWSYTPALNVAPFDTNNTLTFMMTPNLKLVARFETPFSHLNGVWSGLFAEPTIDSRSAGFLTFNFPYTNNVENKGYYSGRILLDGTQYRINYPDGVFDITGHSHVVVPRTGKSSLTIDMDMDLVTYSGTITGTVTTPEWTANLLLHRGWTNVGDAEFRRYTMAFPPVSGPTPSPTGWGVAATTNSPGGIVHFVGFAADGAQINTPITYVSENLEYPFYGQLYGTASTGYQGSMWGWLTFSKDQPGVTGTVYWWHPAGVTNAGYTGGFSNVCQVIGSPYTNFPAGMPDFGWTGPAVASFSDDSGLSLTSTASVANTDRVTFTIPNTNLVALTVTRINGLFNGTFLQPIVHKRKDPPFRGVILQNTRINLGNFWTDTNAGAVIFAPQ